RPTVASCLTSPPHPTRLACLTHLTKYDRLIVSFVRAVGAALAHARPVPVAVAVALHLSGLLVTGERWRIVVVALGGRLTLVRSTLINLAGIFVRNATPTTGLGGHASR